MVVAYAFCSASFLSSCGDLSSCLLHSKFEGLASGGLRPVDFATPRSPLCPLRAHHFFMVRFVAPFPDLTLVLTSFHASVGKSGLPKWSEGLHRKSYGWRSFPVKHQSSWFFAAASSSGTRKNKGSLRETPPVTWYNVKASAIL